VIPVNEKKLGKFLYTEIDYIESRADSTQMGFVQVGAFNKKASIITNTPLNLQLKTMVKYLTDSTLKMDSKLIFQLRKLEFAELTTRTENGYFSLRANLFVRKGDQCQKLLAIDTSLIIHSSDVTKPLLRTGGNIIRDFISLGLQRKPIDSTYYTFNELRKMDSLDKLKLRLYYAQKYREGIYMNYASFRDQGQPLPIVIDTSGTKKKSVIKTKNQYGLLVNIDPQSCYAYVYNNQIYVSTPYGYYPLTKSGDDFYYTGKARVSADIGAMLIGGLLMGGYGVGRAADNNTAVFEMKLDYIDGSFIKVKEIK
jgi:hypothetical protein